MKWIAIAIVTVALLAGGVFLYLQQTGVTCETLTQEGRDDITVRVGGAERTLPGEPDIEYEVCRDRTGKIVDP